MTQRHDDKNNGCHGQWKRNDIEFYETAAFPLVVGDVGRRNERLRTLHGAQQHEQHRTGWRRVMIESPT